MQQGAVSLYLNPHPLSIPSFIKSIIQYFHLEAKVEIECGPDDHIEWYENPNSYS